MHERLVLVLHSFSSWAMLFSLVTPALVVLFVGSKISEGSIFSPDAVFPARPPVRGVLGTVVVVFLLPAAVDFRGLLLGAGVKSSSLSCCIFDCCISSSS